jgi:pimeloyl-ACP methyl ester carboxylesterase
MWMPLLIGALAMAPPLPAVRDCPETATCGSITVPLDHTGGTPGTLPLAYARIPATGVRTGTIVVLTGGPGQPAIAQTKGYRGVLRGPRWNHDLVLVDQRGSGGSGAVNCSPAEVHDGAACAAKLGVRRAIFTTYETVSDIEDLRVALGVERLTLLGVSYGTKVAEEYARRFPDHTAALVLDSPVYPGGPSLLNLEWTRSYARVLRALCTGACRRTVGDPMAALARAFARWRKGPVRGPLVGQDGQVRAEAVTEARLLQTLQGSDLQSILRAQLPAAFASLARGDAAPFIHAIFYFPPDSGITTESNTARLLATDCIEGELPWAPESRPETRTKSLQAHLATLGLSPFGLFGNGAGVEASLVPPCLRWPATPKPPPAPAAVPDVPVLVLSGRDDLRTPLEDARRVAAQYPRATVLDLAGYGHAILRSSNGSACGPQAVAVFLSGGAVSPCTPSYHPKVYVADRYRPADLRDVVARRLAGLPGRTLGAVYETLDASARDRAGFANWYRLATPVALPALRRGYVIASHDVLEFHGAEVIRGVRLDGRFARTRTGHLTVSGPAAAGGTLTFRRGRVSGTLGGVTI